MFGSFSGPEPEPDRNRFTGSYSVPAFRFGTAKPELEKPETGKPNKPNRKCSGVFRFLNRYSPVPFSGSGGVWGVSFFRVGWCLWCLFLVRVGVSGSFAAVWCRCGLGGGACALFRVACGYQGFGRNRSQPGRNRKISVQEPEKPEPNRYCFIGSHLVPGIPVRRFEPELAKPETGKPEKPNRKNGRTGSRPESTTEHCNIKKN